MEFRDYRKSAVPTQVFPGSNSMYLHSVLWTIGAVVCVGKVSLSFSPVCRLSYSSSWIVGLLCHRGSNSNLKRSGPPSCPRGRRAPLHLNVGNSNPICRYSSITRGPHRRCIRSLRVCMPHISAERTQPSQDLLLCLGSWA